MNIKLKICGMRDVTNIKDVALCKPDYMGFIFYPKSLRYVGENPSPEIFSSVNKSIYKVGVFVNEGASEITRLAKEYGLTHIQLHGMETECFCKRLQNENLIVIKAFGIDEQFTFENLNTYSESCDYFLFDTKTIQHGGSGVKFNWNILNKYTGKTPFFLSGGIDSEDIHHLKTISHPQFYAIDINSRFEEKPGFKNSEKIKKFITEIKNSDK